MMKKILLAVSGLMMFSCFEQGECTDVSSNLVKVGFYNSTDRKLRTISLDSITVDGAPKLQLFAKTKLSKVELPLNQEWDSVTFRIYYTGTVASLTVNYQIKTFALAADCVAVDLYNITEASATAVKQVFYVQRKITENDKENLQLYF